MALNFSVAGDSGCVTADFPLTAETAEGFRERVFHWLDSSPRMVRVVLDLSAVNILDSAGLGALMALRKAAADRGAEMVVAGLQAKPLIVFEITRADRVIRVFKTVADAMAAPPVSGAAGGPA
jgi:anti-sigma B factor antagonist